MEHLILTVENARLKEKAVQKEWTLAQFLSEAAQLEDIHAQMKAMSMSDTGTLEPSTATVHSANCTPQIKIAELC